MKYPYTIGYTSRGYPIMRLSPELLAVETFFFNDVQRLAGDYYLEAIDKVLQGGEPFWNVTGNVCRLEITRDFTRVVNTLTGEDIPAEESSIETSELRELLVVWREIIDQFVRPQKHERGSSC